MPDFLVVYDYGQGAIWRYLSADSPEQIRQTFPELEIVDTAPSWMSADYLEQIKAKVQPIEGPYSGFFESLIEERDTT